MALIENVAMDPAQEAHDRWVVAAWRFATSKKSDFGWNSILKPWFEDYFSKNLMGEMLDAGCGAGDILSIQTLSYERYLGVDWAATMLEISRNRYPSNSFMLADVRDLSQVGNSEFDSVVCINVAADHPDVGRAFSEFRRVLRPGGRLLLATEHPSWTSGKDAVSKNDTDYFHEFIFESAFLGEDMPILGWHRNVQEYATNLSSSGFRLNLLIEPSPIEQDPGNLGKNLDEFPMFLIFECEAI